MSAIKNVGSMPVTATRVQQQTEVQPKPESRSAPAELETRPLSQEGKAAKSSEAIISGEVMRQKVLKQAENLGKQQANDTKERPSTSASYGSTGEQRLQKLEKRIGEAGQKAASEAKAAAEKMQGENVDSPAGVPYKREARVPDNTPIFKDGKLDREKVLKNLSQYDENPKTTQDKDRCGGTAVIASAINNGGEQGLLKLTGAVKKNLLPEARKEVEAIEQKIKNKTATHGDLGRLSELINDGYGVRDPKTQTKGLLDGDMHSLYKDAGLKPPSRAGDPDEIFENGQSWPVNLDTDGDGKPNHWIIAGKDEKGRPFIYDPESTPGKPQIHYKGSPEYNKYIRQINDTDSGFAPITKQKANEARQKYDEEHLME